MKKIGYSDNVDCSNTDNAVEKKLLAFSSGDTNLINIIDIGTKQNYATFEGAQLANRGNSNWTYVREIPNTRLLISLFHAYNMSANLEIFDISQKEKARRVYSFEEAFGVAGAGDVTYNSRRNILGAICIEGKIAYHLFALKTNTPKADEIARLCRKSKWHHEYVTGISGFDFNSNGEYMGTIDRAGVCLVSAINTGDYSLHLKLKMRSYRDNVGHCRWSTNYGEPLLFLKYDNHKLNALDTEKKTLLLKEPLQLESDGSWTRWIDVCPTNGHLVASCGNDKNIKIYDHRQGEIVKIFNWLHSEDIRCVRWNPNGNLLATASEDKRVKILDVQSGKAIHTATTSDQNCADSVCFL